MTRRQLRAWRLSLAWTQSEAATFYGVQLRQWQRYEAGDTPIPANLPRIIKLWEGSEALRAKLGVSI